MDDAQHRERERFFGAAKLVAILTLLSRILGMVRDMSIVWLGARWQNDAFQFAFALPNLFRRLFGEGALSAAFVPVFTETSETSGADKARMFLANAMGLLAVFLIGLMVLIQAGLLAWVLLSPPDRQDRQFLVLLTSIMLPFMVLVCLLALASAALNCRGRFAYPAAAPIILNLCMIAADVVANLFWPGDRSAQLVIISASVTVAGVIQLVGVLWLLKASGFAVRPRLRPVEPGVTRMLKLMGPALLGMGFLQISSLFDYLVALFFSANQYTSTFSIFGWQVHRPLTEGVLVRVAAAQRLYQFPMGVFAISLGVAVFPLLSRYASRNDMPNLRRSLNRAIRLALMEGLATGTGLFVLAEPIVRLIYRHYDFADSDARTAAFILRMYVLGMAAYCLYQILTRAFYSMKDTKTPLKVSCVLAAVYMGLVSCLIWIPQLGPGAFGLTPAITFSINILVLAIILRRRVGILGGRQIATSVVRSLVACAVMVAFILLAQWCLESVRPLAPGPANSGPLLWAWIASALKWMLGPGFNLTVVLVCVFGGAGAFLLTARILHAPELGELFGAARKKESTS
jgi:putative peptidoglycan lipid II flippase